MTTPGLRIGRYEVGERLGKGGFGVVHVAHDLELGREVAIKFLRPEYMMRKQVVGRFLQEARACAKIGHPGIVTVFEAGLVEDTGTRLDGTAYIAMERLHGETLGARLKAHGRLPAIAAIGIARQLATALAVAHEAGIIHRDLKPDNVYLVRDAAVVGGERVKILDFGVAKLADPDASGESDVNTHSQMMLGTPRYMSPEQARSAGKVDLRTDIYALGCLLYELVVGKPPFGGDIGDIIVAHQTAPITPPRELVSSVPGALDSLIVQLLAKEPEDRPSSMRIVDDALDKVFSSLAPAKKRAPTDVDDEKTTRKVLPDELFDRSMPTPVTELKIEPPTLVRAPIFAEETLKNSVAAAQLEQRALLLKIAIGVGAAVISGLIVYLILRGKDPPATVRIVVDAPLPDAVMVVEAIPIDAPDPDEARLHAVENALAASDLKTALTAIAEIPEASVYRKQAEAAYAAAKGPIVDGLVAELNGYTQARDCARHATRLREFEKKYGSKLANEGRLIAQPCKSGAATNPPSTPTGSPTPLDACDPKTVVDAEQRADSDLASGSYAAALVLFEKLVKCKPALISKAYLTSCRARAFVTAKKLFLQLPTTSQERMAQICIKEGYDPRGTDQER